MKKQSQFSIWYFNEFVRDPLFIDMTDCNESSKWHREGSVAIHTNMVVAEYIARAGVEWTRSDLLGALACAFHDVGKPMARTRKESEERGVYFSYGGHEIMSARLWEDWVCRNQVRVQDLFQLTPDEIFKITWMIEHHRPWGLKDKTKRMNLFATAELLVGMQPYLRMLAADNWGRIGDDQIENRRGVSAWLCEFMDDHQSKFQRSEWEIIGDFMPSAKEPGEDASNLYVLIGCSGSGKSSFARDSGIDAYVYSWDQIRMDWYDADDYTNAFNMSTEDDQFRNKVNSMFTEMVNSGRDVIVDNVNTSAKRRKFFIDQARRNGYRITAVTFPVAMNVPLDRQHTREDKTIPYNAVKSQYMNTQMPQFGEFDNIIVMGSNL